MPSTQKSIWKTRIAHSAIARVRNRARGAMSAARTKGRTDGTVPGQSRARVHMSTPLGEARWWRHRAVLRLVPEARHQPLGDVAPRGGGIPAEHARADLRAGRGRR